MNLVALNESLPLTALEMTPQQVRALAESAGLDSQVSERLTRTSPDYSPSDMAIVLQLFAGFMFVGGRWVEPTLLDVQGIEERIERLVEQIEREQRQAERVRFHLHLSAEAKRKSTIRSAAPVKAESVEVEPVDGDGRIDPGPFNPPLPEPATTAYTEGGEGEGSETPGEGGETPGEGGETPGEGSETPGEGSETPGEGSETPEGGPEAADSAESVSGDGSGPSSD